MIWNEHAAHVSGLSELVAALHRATDDDLTVVRSPSPSRGEVRFVLKPDRRQIVDRRKSRRGGLPRDRRRPLTRASVLESRGDNRRRHGGKRIS